MAKAMTELDRAIRAVAPINGISVGNPLDKKTWRVDFDGASRDQIAAAQSVIADFIYADAPEVDPLVEIKARLSAIEAKEDGVSTTSAVPIAMPK